MSTDKAKELRKSSTDAERKLWQHLRRYQINGHKLMATSSAVSSP
jgi:very-short-patch-repair endonuclease